ncbi:Transglycosylase SLT domain-containing protein [Celeribacter baekdonensis]|uniref:Transglycosylase SLT domain-containing protein n=1 Tax=Celeribacter baekdonensis TaxID=875171 RepID=A0A1G7FMZ6_9RHOB|nr:lytic transglycosylase domain-containing protein [Celeribacter baekdonensis]SDE77311.1 Transglycosylase SLT domain-containing protein [Celeribacter baekdonensis]
MGVTGCGRGAALRVGLFGFLCATGYVGAAGAEDIFSTKNRLAIFGSQLDVLDGRAADQYSNSVTLQPERFGGATVGLPFMGTYKGEWLPVATNAARKHGVPTDLFLRLVQQESGWNPRAKSPVGATGLAQLMPETARRLGVNINDPAQNLEGGARYLRQMYNRFGNWRLALAAYNAGPEAVTKYNGVPPYKETMNYVRVIWGS